MPLRRGRILSPASDCRAARIPAAWSFAWNWHSLCSGRRVYSSRSARQQPDLHVRLCVASHPEKKSVLHRRPARGANSSGGTHSLKATCKGTKLRSRSNTRQPQSWPVLATDSWLSLGWEARTTFHRYGRDQGESGIIVRIQPTNESGGAK